jgi:hypothetical protein
MSHRPRKLRPMAFAIDFRITCTYCDDNLEHCHGVAIAVGDVVVCSDDPDCDVSSELHRFIAFEE